MSITSYGSLHGPPPPGDAYVVDVSTALRNPHEDAAMRSLTALDAAVYRHVMETPGALQIAMTTAARLLALVQLGDGRPVNAFVYCRGGRHRSPSLAWSTSISLWREGIMVVLTHRDIDKPVVQPL